LARGRCVGHRQCPNPDCRGHVFVVLDLNRKVLQCHPPIRVDFDTTDIPDTVVEPLEEAITCLANDCFVAAAIMVRKSLECLCRENQATGGNLQERIKALATKIVLPQELLTGIDQLRLLGNDAVHVESQKFENIGREEIEVAIELTKEVLKARYQYSNLLAKLLALKKAP
jgi:hypothetical protein